MIGRLGYTGAVSRVGGDAAAQLQRKRVLSFFVAHEAVVVVVRDRAVGDHFGVWQCVLGEQRQQVPQWRSVQPIMGRRRSGGRGVVRDDI